MIRMNMASYVCHKKVNAARITDIKEMPDGSSRISYDSADGGTAHISVKRGWMKRHTGISVGGYLVLYEDGYMSCSPRGVFENGYTKDAP